MMLMFGLDYVIVGRVEWSIRKDIICLLIDLLTGKISLTLEIIH